MRNKVDCAPHGSKSSKCEGTETVVLLRRALLSIPMLVILGQATADDWPPRIVTAGFYDPKTELEGPGSPLPTLSMPFQPAPLDVPLSSDLSQVEDDELFEGTDRWLTISIAPTMSYQDFNTDVSGEDVLGGGFVTRVTLAPDGYVQPFFLGHYNGYSHGSDFSTSVGVVLLPIPEMGDGIELGASYDWIGIEGRFGTGGVVDRHQLTTAIGVFLTDTTRVRGQVSFPVSDRQRVIGPGVDLVMNPRQMTLVSLDQQVASDLFVSLKYLHLADPDDSYLGLAIDACLTSNTSLFIEGYSDMSGTSFGVAGIAVFLDPVDACQFRPLFDATHTWIGTMSAPVVVPAI